MKKLLCYLLLLILSLSLALAGEVWFPGEQPRVWHHEAAAEAAFCDPAGEGVFCTHLPLVLIDTAGTGPSLSQSIGAKLQIIAHPEGHNHLDSSPTLAAEVRLQIRNTSAARYEKKPYRLTFPEEECPSLLDMPSGNVWDLTGPFLDKALLRDYLMVNLAGQITGHAPEVRFCEVFLNGDYRGIYLLSQSPAEAVTLTAPDPDRPGTGYLLSWKGGGDPLNTFGLYSGMYQSPLSVEFPNSADGRTETHLEYIRQDVSAFEAALTTGTASSFIDTPSFIDYFLLNEFAMNIGAAQNAGYVFKAQGGKLTIGPIQDFETAFNNHPDYALPTGSFFLTDSPWYRYLLRDRSFTEQVIRRYAQLRKGVLSTEQLEQTLDDAAAFLAPALRREEARFGHEASLLENAAYPDFAPLSTERNPASYEEALTRLKDAIRDRGAFLDQHIGILRQFSAAAP